MLSLNPYDKKLENYFKFIVKNKRQNSAFTRRHFIWRATAVLMFFYLCADVSVFEYFEGNQSLGIVSYRQVVELVPPTETSESGPAKDSAFVSLFTTHGEGTNIPSDDGDDFCCSSHALVAYKHLIVLLSPDICRHQAPNFSNQRTYSNWHSPPFYRPPRFI